MSRSDPRTSPPPAGTAKGAPRILITLAEKRELEALIERQLGDFYAKRGGRVFLEPGWGVALSAARGTEITDALPQDDELARVPFRDLLSIRSMLAIDLPTLVISRSMLPNLASEATKELARQVNDLAQAARQPVAD
ncbi:MAG TPA: hypothetical protein VFV17_09030 [Usitatibacteraceae bacterium]|nr:hypothetical protein [Usitatibacteraceae bacterium]